MARLLRTSALFVALAVLAAACGSTLEGPDQAGGAPADTGQAPAGEDVQSGLAPAQPPPGAGDQAAPGQPPGTGTGGGQAEGGFTAPQGGGGGQAGGAQGGGGGQAGGAQGGGGGQAGGAQGGGGSAAASNEPIQIGVIVGEGFDNVNENLGGDVGGLGDNRKQAQAVIDDINSRGGLLGRPIEPVFGVRNDNSTMSYSEQEQAICSLWTQDNDVFAAVGVVNIYENLLSCMAKTGKPFLTQHLYPYDKRIYDSYPQTFTPSMLGQDEMAQVYVDRLHAQGYFEGGGDQGALPGEGVKVGLVRYDYPSFARVASKVVRPALRAHGIKLASEYAVRPDQSAREQGNVSAEAQSAVLQFKSEGVTHVLLLDRGAYLAVFFTQAAESQQYRPRYGLTTIDGPGIILQDTAANQMRGALGIGWEPLMDVPIESQPEESPPAQKCNKMMEEEAGQDMNNALVRLVAYQYCDTLWFLEQAVTRGGDHTLEAFMAGAEGTGTKYVSPITFRTAFGPDRHYGAAAVRDLAFSQKCQCFKYTSKPHPLR